MPYRKPIAVYASGTPTAYTATTTSGKALAKNLGRRYAVFCNTSSTITVFLSIGSPAVIGSGIPVMPNGGIYEMGVAELSQADVFAIAATATANVSIFEGV